MYIYIYIYVMYIPWLRGIYGQYQGARVLYLPYILRSHGTYNIFYS